ncbi:hypothetical protein AVEN_11313-1 [Araneus ventricosus]|uniref:ATP-dependent DNA helicase PIF1 n=1 Tax=Araneus ventricosus TaxID=182803 RepID=A0A4Y2E216_ARAVE|nr:hypothetical protein AVEN_11313-1 [Araneus ventricosus]
MQPLIEHASSKSPRNSCWKTTLSHRKTNFSSISNSQRSKCNRGTKQEHCNGTRLSITGLHENLISAKTVSECNRDDAVFLPTIELAPSDVNLPFVLKRHLFPLIPAYAMTINRSQGQSFDHVGIYLDEPVFSHGQLCVELSRSRNPNQFKIYTKTSEVQGKLLDNEKYFTRKIVYKEVF